MTTRFDFCSQPTAVKDWITNEDNRELIREEFGGAVVEDLDFVMLLEVIEAGPFRHLEVLLAPATDTAPVVDKETRELAKKVLADFKFVRISDRPHLFNIMGSSARQGMERQARYRYTHIDATYAIYQKGAETPFLYSSAPYVQPDGSAYDNRFLVIHPDDRVRFMAFVAKLDEITTALDGTRRSLTIWSGKGQKHMPLPKSSWSKWDDVFLSPEIEAKVKDDLHFFFNNRDFFLKHNIPHKRGYLLCGPPGCGKTMICRTIATSLPVNTAAMFDFSDPEATNTSLTQAFQSVAADAPSVFFLEDIDRVYDADRTNTRITLDHLLNCLDGISVNDCMIVVATANDPKKLDPAILKRPGRFDRVVVIDVPDKPLRRRYLGRLFKDQMFTDFEFDVLVRGTEGMSMAFLKEVFVAAATIAFANKRTSIGFEDAIAGLEQVSSQFDGPSNAGNRRTGFGA